MPDKELQRLFDLIKGEPESGRVRFWLLRNGNVVIDFVIQVEVAIDGRIYTVRRYDCVHGQPHCDVYDHRGHHRKEWIAAATRKEAWDAAMHEVLIYGRFWVLEFSEHFGKAF